jgi:hypothetical protein
MSCLKFLSVFSGSAALVALAAPAAWAQPRPAAPPTTVAALAPTAVPGEADLVQRARAWLAATHTVPSGAVGVQPLDARVQVRGCASGWVFDQPFPQNDGVLRARCADSNWQVFLSVTLPRPAPGTPATPGATVAARGPVGAAPLNTTMATTGMAATTATPAPIAPVNATAPASPALASPLPAFQPPAPAAPPAVRRGNTVLTTWTPSPGLVITARLEALDDGRLGDTIRVRNRDSGRVLAAQVSGQNQAVGQ